MRTGERRIKREASQVEMKRKGRGISEIEIWVTGDELLVDTKERLKTGTRQVNEGKDE